MDSLFPECQDADVCISQAADSIGLKEIPKYEIKMVEQYDWVRKTQVNFSFSSIFVWYNILVCCTLTILDHTE